MNDGMKYVYFNNNDFFIFPAKITHDEVADMYKPLKPVSAGFCSIESTVNDIGERKYKVDVFGGSLSLKMNAIQEHGNRMAMILSEG